MIDHSNNCHPTAAQIVGVHRPEDTYKSPIPPASIDAFYGVAEGRAAASMAGAAAAEEEGAAGQSQEAAMAQFFGMEEPKKGL